MTSSPSSQTARRKMLIAPAAPQVMTTFSGGTVAPGCMVVTRFAMASMVAGRPRLGV